MLRYKKATLPLLAICLVTIATIQLTDIWFSEKATIKREGFAQIQRVDQPEFVMPGISDLLTTQQHLVMLDRGFRGDQSGTYKIAQAALANNLTLNIGFFARIPEPIWTQQANWRKKVENFSLSRDDLANNLFVTRDSKFAEKLSMYYQVVERDKFYFILEK